jgi:dTDP-glucose pyrophosphorylase
MHKLEPKKWKECCLYEHASLGAALENLSRTGLQIVLIVSAQGRLLGTVTDGDIRRALMDGVLMDGRLDRIMNTDPRVVGSNVRPNDILNVMRLNGVRQIPIVDANGSIEDLVTWQDTVGSDQRSELFVVMAGGEGRRLHPYTEHCPKPLLPVNGKPMLQHIVERARDDGFHRFLFIVHYLGHMIQDYFSDGSQWNVDIDYVWEEVPLGTAGGLSLLPTLSDAPLVVSNGDVLCDVRYGDILEFHIQQKAQATMAIRTEVRQQQFGVVVTNGPEILSIEEKPIVRTNINAGIYILEPQVLKLISPTQVTEMPDLFQTLAKSVSKVVAYPVHESWIDMGNKRDYDLAQARFDSADD